MATIVCQGLQSCLDSHLAEPTSVRLKLSSPRPQFPQPHELALKSCLLDSNAKEDEDACHIQETCNKSYNHGSSNPDMGGWSFLQAISVDAMEKENAYVHPLVKRSSAMLSEKSLELCTENLGNETGTDINEGSIFSLPSSDFKGGNSPTREQAKPRQLFGAKKANPHKFPPPLTTISGSDSLRVRPHREGGRLIIKAVKAPATNSYFQAERSHGRLRICFFKNWVDSEELAENEENEASDEEEEEEAFENDTYEEKPQEEEDEEEEEEEEEEGLDDDGESDVYLGQEMMDGNYVNYDEAEMGIMEKFERPTRCKEGDQHEKKRLLDCKPLWVAT
ncbi:protein FANTASTIC FOUR 3 [Corylus avellana]|uniref:protein FANTASTIC FOUR 3 n=1 Tax=Corylus avellana TaxID=13451 RepID=UPI001E2261BE|nr:protein FANTASTIC FOUR 3 [Corylus avellana]